MPVSFHAQEYEIPNMYLLDIISEVAYSVWHVPPSLVLNIFMIPIFPKAETVYWVFVFWHVTCYKKNRQ